jgi:hypothetical protein
VESPRLAPSSQPRDRALPANSTAVPRNLRQEDK